MGQLHLAVTAEHSEANAVALKTALSRFLDDLTKLGYRDPETSRPNADLSWVGDPVNTPEGEKVRVETLESWNLRPIGPRAEVSSEADSSPDQPAKEPEAPTAELGPPSGGWYPIIVNGVVVTKIRGKEAAEAYVEGL